MNDDTEQTEVAPTMGERIRDTMAERQRANHVRLFGSRDSTDSEPLPDDDDAA